MKAYVNANPLAQLEEDFTRTQLVSHLTNTPITCVASAIR